MAQTPDRGTQPERIMQLVDAMTPEQRALVGEYGFWPVHLAMGKGYREGPTLRREVVEISNEAGQHKDG